MRGFWAPLEDRKPQRESDPSVMLGWVLAVVFPIGVAGLCMAAVWVIRNIEGRP
jgi:hypothetical protein